MSIGYHDIIVAIFSLLFVSALIYALAIISTRLQARRLPSSSRLALVETLHLDRSRQVRVLSFDGYEFLLISGGPRDEVILDRRHRASAERRCTGLRGLNP